jgi:hypothetical protein
MNDRGQVAFRADATAGGSGIWVGAREEIITVADTSDIFSGFQGLPVLNNKGTVVFRADLKNGGQGIYTSKDGARKPVVDTSSRFSELGRFPSFNDAGAVAFNATLKSGVAGIFTVTGEKITTVIDTDSPFESFRGVLINNAGTIVFYATPKGGELGIYCGPDPTTDRILSIGETLFESMVAEFALNPVSMNELGQVAIRIKFANERQVIVRADPGK